MLMLKMPKALTPARTKKRMKMEAMPEQMFWKSNLPRPVAELLFLLLDLALLMPMSPLLQLHLPAALPLPLPLRRALKTLKFYQVPSIPVIRLKCIYNF
jgi:hypothetical protein